MLAGRCLRAGGGTGWQGVGQCSETDHSPRASRRLPLLMHEFLLVGGQKSHTSLTHVLPMFHTCPTHVLHMYCTCPKHVLRTSSTVPAHVLLLSYTLHLCTAHVADMCLEGPLHTIRFSPLACPQRRWRRLTCPNRRCYEPCEPKRIGATAQSTDHWMFNRTVFRFRSKTSHAHLTYTRLTHAPGVPCQHRTCSAFDLSAS